MNQGTFSLSITFFEPLLASELRNYVSISNRLSDTIIGDSNMLKKEDIQLISIPVDNNAPANVPIALFHHKDNLFDLILQRNGLFISFNIFSEKFDIETYKKLANTALVSYKKEKISTRKVRAIRLAFASITNIEDCSLIRDFYQDAPIEFDILANEKTGAWVNYSEHTSSSVFNTESRTIETIFDPDSGSIGVRTEKAFVSGGYDIRRKRFFEVSSKLDSIIKYIKSEGFNKAILDCYGLSE